MRVLGYIVRRQLARHGATTVALVLLVALGSGAVMALVAGARRTQEALPEFTAYAEATGDATVFHDAAEAPSTEEPQADAHAALLDLNIVDRAVRAGAFLVEVEYRDGSRQRGLSALPLDPGHADVLFGRPIVVDGRWPADTDAVGAAVDEELAARAGLTVGSTWRVRAFSYDQLETAGGGADVEATGPTVDLAIRAIVRFPSDLHPVDLRRSGIYTDRSELYLTPAFWQVNGPDLARYGVGTVVDLVPEATVEDLTAELDAALGAGRWFVEQTGFRGADSLGGIERAVELEARGLLTVATVTGVAAVALLALTLVRLAAADERRSETLGALGLGHRDLRRLAVLRGLIVGLAGAGLGAVGAVWASTWTPVGVAGRAELRPGVELDWTVLSAGTVATVLLLAALHAAASIVAVSSRRPVRRRSSAPVVRTVAPGPVARVGLGFALSPESGGRSVPARSALAGTAVAVAVAVAALVAATSFASVEDDPRRHGVYWDAGVGNFASSAEADAAAEVLGANPEVAGFAGQTYNEVVVDGHMISALTIFDGRGELAPVIVEGRAPAAEREIALGRMQMDRLGVEVGDVLLLRMTAEEPVEFEVVGRALVGELGDTGGSGNPAKGAIIHASSLLDLDPRGAEHASPQWYVVQLVDGVERDAALEQLDSDFPLTLTVPVLPSDLTNLRRLGGALRLLTVLVALLGAGAALAATIGAVHRRRTELAVLRSMGFRPRQAGASIAWQAATFGILGLAVGLPLGVVTGRWGWTVLAADAGLEPAPVVPIWALVVVIVVVMAVLEVIAGVPAAVATRLRPAQILRSE